MQDFKTRKHSISRNIYSKLKTDEKLTEKKGICHKCKKLQFKTFPSVLEK